MPVKNLRLIVKPWLHSQMGRRSLLALTRDSRIDPEQRLICVERRDDVFEFVVLLPGVVGGLGARGAIFGQRKGAKIPLRHEGRIVERELHQDYLRPFRVIEKFSVCPVVNYAPPADIERRVEMNEVARVIRLQG